jgi:hypothetical protein
VKNSGSLANSVIPGITLTATGTASADCGPPNPTSGKLGNGAQSTFTFSCTNVTGSGTLAFQVTLTAIDDLTGSGISVTPATSNAVTVLGAPPRISVAATSNGAPYTSGQWTNLDVVLTFTCTPSSGAPTQRVITVTRP